MNRLQSRAGMLRLILCDAVEPNTVPHINRISNHITNQYAYACVLRYLWLLKALDDVVDASRDSHDSPRTMCGFGPERSDGTITNARKDQVLGLVPIGRVYLA